MSALFENYDDFCEEVYRLFKYDLRGGENEYRVIGYMIFVAVSKAYEEQVDKLSHITDSLEKTIVQHEEISSGTRKGLMSSVKLLSEILDKKYKEINDLRMEVHEDLTKKIEEEMYAMAARALKNAISKNGLTLNQQLSSTIQELNSASVDVISSTDRMTKSIKKSLSASTLRLFCLPLLGTIVGVVLVLILQSVGAISLPVQVNLDTDAFIQQIFSHSR
ncbi:hypothetical protein CPJ78_18050 [Salmonella enterica]|nr:hypothetical protein [Salmonella enterica]